ncbi:(2Fe-2S)-binding protein [Streptomyces sp. DSM 44917]|uniref:(2Fe-2S)-binding protein n=1 Tax=Streptomyces boetiae TaxID=3075541 RepID=A0ABU2LFL2_9ACTN|nr:(2Fe-2S)-binding protein [Streptomyces sp. DSM 44917]MDT0310383.1 (2Fe-2S)-binding protein [Streptomyces sp. DSM 44917]
MERLPAREPVTPGDDFSGIGPFFAIRVHPAGARLAPPWRPLEELERDAEALLARVAAVRARIAAAHGLPPQGVEFRVAASVAHLGLAARLLSPALVLALTRGRPLAPGLAGLWWQPVLGRPVPLSVPELPPAPRGDGAAPPDPECLLRACLDTGPAAGLTGAFAALPLSSRVLWGNAASALHSAAEATAAARPDLAEAAWRVTAALLESPPLRAVSGHTAEGRFRRRSCCLYYRAAPGKAGPVCGDCVLTPVRRPRESA